VFLLDFTLKSDIIDSIRGEEAMKHRAFIDKKERVGRSELAKLVHDRSWIKATLVTMKRKCGKKTCRCVDGEKHQSLYLAMRIQGKRKMIFIPSEWENTVRRWVDNYKLIEQKMDLVSQKSLQKLLDAKQKKKEQRKPGSNIVEKAGK